MPFVLDPNPTFQAPVRFKQPGAEGSPKACEFTGVFRLLDDEQGLALAKRAQEEQWSDRQLAAEILVGWGADVTDAAGLPLPVTPDNLAAVLRTPGCAPAVLLAYKKAVEDAAAGN